MDIKKLIEPETAKQMAYKSNPEVIEKLIKAISEATKEDGSFSILRNLTYTERFWLKNSGYDLLGITDECYIISFP